MSEIQTSSSDFGRSTLVPIPDTVQQTERSKQKRLDLSVQFSDTNLETEKLGRFIFKKKIRK